MGPGSRFACPGRRWGLLYFRVIASASEAIPISFFSAWIASPLSLPCANASRLSQAMTSVSFPRKQEPIATGVCVGLNRRTRPRKLDVGGYGSRIALRLSGTTVGVALFPRHCERQRSNPHLFFFCVDCFAAFASLRKRFAFVASYDIGVVPAKAGTHSHGCLCRTEPPHQTPQT